MRRSWFVLFAAAGLLAVAGFVDPLREQVWAPLVAAPLTRTISRAFGLLPTSAAEVIEGTFFLLLLGALVRIIRSVIRRQRAEAVQQASTLAIVLAAVVVSFYTLWGLHYADKPLATRLGWNAASPDTEEILDLGARLVDVTNQAKAEIPADGPQIDQDQAIEVGLSIAIARLGLPSHHLPYSGPAKPLRLGGRLVAGLGISGFYFPFTAEANIVPGQPEWYAAFVSAHEKAHQRGFASEDEANFIGFLGAIHSTDPLVRYGGWLFAQRQALTAAQRTHPGPVQVEVKRRLPEVQADVLALRAFWQQFEGPGQDVGHALNDAYLRINRVEGGTAAYGESLRLIAAWARTQGQARMQDQGAPSGNPSSSSSTSW